MTDDLAARVEELERRLGRLERALGGIVTIDEEPTGELLLTGSADRLEAWCESLQDRLDELAEAVR